MAIGYSKIIRKVNDRSLESWLDFLYNNFKSPLTNSSMFVTTDGFGKQQIVPYTVLKQDWEEKSLTFVKVENSFNHTISCSCKRVDDYLIIEEYCLDELLQDEEYNNLFSLLKDRCVALATVEEFIGFIFDRDGYSEDYIFT